MTAVLGAAVTFALRMNSADDRRYAAERRMDGTTQRLMQMVNDEVRRYQEITGWIAASFGSHSKLDAATFVRVTAPFETAVLPAASSIAFIVRADRNVQAAQHSWRSRGSRHLVLRGHPDRAEHAFAVLRTSLSGPGATGDDMAGVPGGMQSLAEAASTDSTVVTGSYATAGPARRAIGIIAPVRRFEEGRGTLTGWIWLELVPQALLKQMASITYDQVGATLSDFSGGLGMVEGVSTDGKSAVWRRTASFPVANKVWTISLATTEDAMYVDDGADLRFLLGAGAVISFLLAAFVFTLAAGRSRARMAADVLRRSESMLQHQKSELAAFAGVVAHDLKGPLAGVAANAEVLRHGLAGGGEPGVLQPALGKVIASVVRMGGLIDDLLAYAAARDAAVHLVDVDLRALVEHVATDHRDAAVTNDAQLPQIEIDIEHTVMADLPMLRQLLDNLIGNAVKYAIPGCVPQIAVTTRLEADAGKVHVMVADRGRGIPTGQHKKVFDAFYRAHDHASVPGTGLGLAICRRIAERHGTSLKVRDAPGGGAEFSFVLTSGFGVDRTLRRE
ncbi:sensor histidine kinase [Actinoplanes sp. NPDC004185]